MHNYNTVSEAISGLSGRGYTRDFNAPLAKECMACHSAANVLSPDDFEIDEVHRFEGLTQLHRGRGRPRPPDVVEPERIHHETVAHGLRSSGDATTRARR